MIVGFIFRLQMPEDPEEPEGNEELPKPDDDLFDWRLKEFADMGFNYLDSLALSWDRISPSEVREKWMRKRGWTHDQVMAYYLH